MDGLIDALAKGQIAPEAFKIVKMGYEAKIGAILLMGVPAQPRH